MSTISEKIKAQELLLETAKNTLVEMTKNIEEDMDNEVLLAQVDEQSAQVEVITKQLGSLKAAEKAIGARIEAPAVVKSQHLGSKAGFDTLVKGVTAMAIGRATGKNPEQVAQERYHNDESALILTKAVSNPAFTTTAGWAQELVRDSYGEFMEALRNVAVYPKVPMNNFSFNGAHSIRIPMGIAGGLNGSFIGEGAPIPVQQGSVGMQTLNNFKMACISTYTREMFQQSSNPNIEAYIRSGILNDTAATLDSLYLGNSAGTSVAPAGIRTYSTGANTAASTGNTFDDILADLRGRLSQLYSQNLGANPVWIMNTQRAIGLSFTSNAAGDLFFKDELARGTLVGIPVIVSNSVPDDIVYLIDAAQYASAGDNPEFVYNESASLHMDTVPTALSTVGTPNAVAAPIRSLYQTDTAAIRMIMPITWKELRTGATQTITAVSW